MSEQETRTADWAERAVREAEGEHPAAGSPSREQQVLERIDRARQRKARIKEDRITLSHGAGGKATHTLIEALFLDRFRNPLLEPLEDEALFAVRGARLALTTDSFVVSPLFFPGGSIGDLAVNGTVNDLAVSGARPLYLSAATSTPPASGWWSGTCACRRPAPVPATP
jgi:hydrogenase expression/formation protein HypE